MADTGVKVAVESFKQFNTVLKDFTNIADNVATKANKVNVSILSISNAFNQGSLTRNFTAFSDSYRKLISTLGRANIDTDKIFKLSGSVAALVDVVNTFSRGLNVASLRNIGTVGDAVRSIGVAISTISSLPSLSLDKVDNLINGIRNLQRAFSDTSAFQRLKTSFGFLSTSLLGAPNIGNFFRSIGDFFKPSLLNSISKIQNIGSLTSFATNISNLLNSFRSFENLPTIDASKIKNLQQSLTAFVKVFTGPTALERIAGLFKFGGGGVLGNIKTGISSIANLFTPSIIGRINAIDENAIAGFGRFARAVIHITNALRILSDLKGIQPDIIRENSKSIKELGNLFTPGILGRIFGKQAFGQFANTNNIKNFQVFGESIRLLSETLQRLSSINIDFNKIRSFGKAIGTLVKEVGNVRISKNAGNLKALGSALTELSSAAAGITLGKIDGNAFQNMGKQLADNLIKGFKEKAEISSPSRVFIRFGRDIANGLMQGISRAISAVANVARTLANAVINTVSRAFNFGRNIATTAFNGIRNFIGRFFGRATQELQIQADQFQEKQKGILSRAFNFAKNLAIGSFAFNQIGTAFRRIFSGGLVGAALEFEDQLAGVFKTINLDDLGYAEGLQFKAGLARGIQELATGPDSLVSGLQDSFGQLTTIAQAAGQLGIAKEDILDFTEVIGQLTIATDLTADSAAFALSRFSAITGTTEFEKLGSTLVNLGNNFAATESEIVEFGQRLAGIGNTAGLTEPQILALGAAMAATGINAEAGGTAMTQFVNKIIESTASGSVELQKFAKLAGLTADDFVKTWKEEPVNAIQALIDGIAKLSSEEQVEVFGDLGLDSIRLSDALRRLSGAEGLLADAIDIANQGWEENVALQNEARIRSETGRSALNRLQNSFKLLSITTQNLFLNSFKNLINSLNNIILGINKFIDVNGDMIAEVVPRILKVVAVFGGLHLAIGNTGAILRALAIPLGGIVTVFTTIAGILFSPIGIIAGFIALKFLPDLIAGFNRETEEGNKAFGEFKDTVSAIVGELGEFIGNMIRVVSLITDLGLRIIGVNSEAGNTFNNLNNLIQPILNFFQNLNDGIQRFIDRLTIIGQITGLFEVPSSDPALQREQEINALIEERAVLFDKLNGKIETQGKTASEQYKIIYGETLTGIAQQHGLKVSDLLAVNPQIENPNLIFAGEFLNIPVTLTDANGNAITTASDLVSGEMFTPEDAQRLAEVNTAINNLQNTEVPAVDKLTELSQTDLFKKVFGDDSGALEKAKRQIDEIKLAVELTKQSGIGFANAIRNVLQGNYTTALNDLKNASIDFARGIETGIGALFGRGAETNVSIQEFSPGDVHAITTQVTGSSANPLLIAFDRYLQELRKMPTLEAAGDIKNKIVEIFQTAIQNITGSQIVQDLKNKFTEGFNKFFGNSEGDTNAADAFSKFLRSTLVLGIGLVVGGPIGAGLSIVNLLVNAISDDFLGIRSRLEESEVGRSIISGVDFIKETFENAIKGIFEGAVSGQQSVFDIGGFISSSGQGLVPSAAATTPFDAFSNNITGAIQNVIDGINNFINSIGPEDIQGVVNLITNIADAIKTFATPIIKTASEVIRDTIAPALSSAFQTIGSIFSGEGNESLGAGLQAIAKILGDVLGVVVREVGLIIATITNIGASSIKFIIEFFLGITNFIGAIASGDGQAAADAIEGLKNSLKEFIESIVFGSADLVINFFEQLTGLDLPTAREAWGILVGIVEGSLRSIFNFFEDAFRRIIFTIRDIEIEAKRPFEDISGLVAVQELTGLGNVLGETISGAIGEGTTVNLDDIVAFEYKGVTTTGSIGALLADQMFTDLLSGETRRLLLDNAKNLVNQFNQTGKIEAASDAIDIYKLMGEPEPVFDIPIEDIKIVIRDLEEGSETQLQEITRSSSGLGKRIGKSTVDGIVIGIKQKQQEHSNAMKNLAIFGYTDFAAAMGSQSPSTKMIEQAGFIVDGLVIGLQEKTEFLTENIETYMIKPFETFADKVKTHIDDTITNIGRLVIAISELDLAAEGKNVSGLIGATIQGRQFGGEIQAGNIYRVLENNLPFEMFESSKGSKYFIANENGQMLSPASGFGIQNNTSSQTSSNVTNINIPVVFENAPIDKSPAELDKLANTIADKVKARFERDAKINNASVKLNRRGIK